MSRLHLPQIEVLIVDDQVPTSELLSEFCLVQGSEVVTANDGRAAIASRTGTASRSHCQQLPGAVGFEVLTADRHSNLSASVS